MDTEREVGGREGGTKDTEGGGTTVIYLYLPIVLSSHTKSV